MAGVGIILSDAVVVYRSEAFYGETVTVAVAVGEFHRVGCDIYYLLTAHGDGREIARVKTGIVFYDYAARKVAPLPPGFREAVTR